MKNQKQKHEKKLKKEIKETKRKKNKKIPKRERLKRTKSLFEFNRTTIKVCTFSPYRERRLSSKQALVVFRGKVRGPTDNFPCRTLVDSGCEEKIVSKTFADKMNACREKTNLTAQLWDGTLVPMDICSENLDLRIGKAISKIRPYIVDLIAHDIFFKQKLVGLSKSYN